MLTFVLGYIDENNHSQNNRKLLLLFIFFKHIDCINDNNNACQKFKYKSKPINNFSWFNIEFIFEYYFYTYMNFLKYTHL